MKLNYPNQYNLCTTCNGYSPLWHSYYPFYHSRQPLLRLQRSDWLRAVVNLRCFTLVLNLACQYPSKLLPRCPSSNRNAASPLPIRGDMISVWFGLCIKYWFLSVACTSRRGRMKILNCMPWWNALDNTFGGWVGPKFHHSSHEERSDEWWNFGPTQPPNALSRAFHHGIQFNIPSAHINIINGCLIPILHSRDISR